MVLAMATGRDSPSALGPVYTLITVTSNLTHYKMWYRITFPFPSSNGPVVDVWKCVSYYIPHFTGMWFPIHATNKANSYLSKVHQFELSWLQADVILIVYHRLYWKRKERLYLKLEFLTSTAIGADGYCRRSMYPTGRQAVWPAVCLSVCLSVPTCGVATL